MRRPTVTSGAQADAARAVRFDRPLVESPAWGDPRLARQVSDAARAGRERGLAEGYAEGWAQGRHAAGARAREEAAERAQAAEAVRAQTASRAQSLLAELAQAARALTEQAVPAWNELTDVLVEGALAIAAAGLARELTSIDDRTLEAVRTALRVLPGNQAIELHVHPGDAALLTSPPPGAGDTAAAPAVPEGVTVVPDADVAAGTVVARTALHSLPVDLLAGIRAAQEVLRS
jgi:flagellar assembly protein FliH